MVVAVLASMAGTTPVGAVTGTEPVTTVTTGSLVAPFAVAADGDGNLYISDRDNHRVRKVDTNDVVTTVAGGNGFGSAPNQLDAPVGVALDGDGNLYVAENNGHRVRRIDSNNVVTTVAGGNGLGSAPNQLSFPVGLTVDGDGNLYITDQGNHRVQKVDTGNVVSTVAGGNGAGSAANQLLGPSGVAFDAAGNLYVADTLNNRIQKLTAEPTTPAVGSRELTGAYAAMSGIEGSVARLYMAVFNRHPDAAGHAYWVGRANNGSGLRNIANFFIGSPEFLDTYRNLDNAGFVALLYRNVMDREGDTAGIGYWTGQLDTGTPRSLVVLQFSESSEFKALTKTS